MLLSFPIASALPRGELKSSNFVVQLFNSADLHLAIVNILKGNPGHHEPEPHLWRFSVFASAILTRSA